MFFLTTFLCFLLAMDVKLTYRDLFIFFYNSLVSHTGYRAALRPSLAVHVCSGPSFLQGLHTERPS